MDLFKIKPTLDKILSSMSLITDVEYAVFSSSSELVSSTKTYLERKGNNVHHDSINEVLNRGIVTVNKPGQMKSCIGCRFVNNCPATIEILSCIDLNNKPIGVLSLTSFSEHGHKKIENDIRSYSDILKNITTLISMYAEHEKLNIDNLTLHHAIKSIADNNNFIHIIIDRLGEILYLDTKVADYIPSCENFYNNLYNIFPEEFVNWTLNSKAAKRKYYCIKNFKGNVYLSPIKVNDMIVGYSLKLQSDDNSMVNNHDNYLDMIISNDIEMENLKNKILRIVNSSSSILITGETGTGKELVAKAIHYTSSRSNSPFVPLNCANIPDNLFESELFGYDEGAFTGAKKGGKQGIFEIANEGTVFLDEIGELPLHLQSKLLRVLQENTIQRIGGTSIIPLNIRIIAATNRNLENMMKNGEFREDLFYRLNVIPFHVPSLKERPNDIKLLYKHFIKKYNSKLNRNINSISDDALSALVAYHWPGNVRELENIIEYAMNFEDNDIINLESLPSKVVTTNSDFNIKNYVERTESDLILSY